MKKAKLFVLLMSLIVAVPAFSGCAGNSFGEKASGASEETKTTLSFAIWDQVQLPAMEKMAGEFQKSHPNVTINVECSNYNDYWTKLDAASAGNTMPDVMWMSVKQIAKYAQAGKLAELTGIDVANFPQTLVSQGKVDGKQYGVPKDFDTVGLWFNKTLFDAKNVDYPTNDWTWDDMVSAAQKLTDAKTDVYGISADYADQEKTYNTIKEAGGFVISEDGKTSGYNLPETIEGMQIWLDLINKYHVSPTQQQLTNTTDIQMFESGKIAMVTKGTWMNSEIANNSYTKDKVDVVCFPSYKGNRNVVIGGLTYVMSANSKAKDIAMEFVKYLGSKDGQIISAEMGAAIPAYNETQDPWVKATPQFSLQNCIDMVKIAYPYPHSPSSPTWSSLEASVFPKAWAGQISLEDACKQVYEGMTKALQEDNS